jgi:citrate synthase
MTDFMTAAQAAQRLGIKPATLCAYVSPGVLGRSKSADGRGSLFDPAEVERLARRGRPRRPAGVADITVKSAITVITADNLRYRGLDATRLAVSHTFEEVAALLWTGDLPSTRATARPAAGPAWRATAAAMAAGRTAQTGLPAGILPLERLQVIGLRSQRPTRCGSSSISRPCSRPGGASSPAWWIACPRPDPSGPTGQAPRRQIRPGRSRNASGRGSAASGPAQGWCARCPRRWCSWADHELAASTVAARVAASVRADPYAVVGTGLGAMSGALHGGASLAAETLIAAASSPDDVSRVVAELRRRGEKMPGFGHLVYRGGDPRAVALLDLVRRAAPKSGQLAVAEAVLTEVRQKSLPAPNVDLALATLTRVAGMVKGAG